MCSQSNIIDLSKYVHTFYNIYYTTSSTSFDHLFDSIYQNICCWFLWNSSPHRRVYWSVITLLFTKLSKLSSTTFDHMFWSFMTSVFHSHEICNCVVVLVLWVLFLELTFLKSSNCLRLQSYPPLVYFWHENEEPISSSFSPFSPFTST